MQIHKKHPIDFKMMYTTANVADMGACLILDFYQLDHVWVMWK